MSRLIVAILLMVMVGCRSGIDQPERTADDRFVVTYSQDLDEKALSWVAVICDTQTDQEYLFVDADQSGGLTPLGTTCQPYVRLLSGD